MKDICKGLFAKNQSKSFLEILGSVGLLLLLIWALIPSKVFPQSLEDFKGAAQKNGVEAIPFEDLRRKAISISDEVSQRKSEVQQFNFSSIEKQKTNLLKEVNKTERNIGEIDKTISDLKKNNKEVDISSFERDKSKLQDELRNNLSAVESFNEQKIAPAIEAFKRLWNARGGLREIFEDAEDRLQKIKSNPKSIIGDNASDSQSEELSRYVSTIIDIISGEIAKTHKDQEEGAIGKQQQYEELLNRSKL